MRWQKQTRHVYILRSKCECAGRNRQDMCIFFVLNVENTRSAFYKTRARKRISIVARMHWQRQTRYVYIFRSKYGKPPEIPSTKRVRFINLARKGISIVARVRWQKQTRYVYVLRSKCGKTPEVLSIKRLLEKQYRS